MCIRLHTYSASVGSENKSVSSEVTHFLSLLFHENVALRNPVPTHFLSIFLASISWKKLFFPPKTHFL